MWGGYSYEDSVPFLQYGGQSWWCILCPEFPTGSSDTCAIMVLQANYSFPLCIPHFLTGIVVFFFNFFNVSLFLRQCERHSASSGGADRGRHRIRSGSRLWAVSTEPGTGLELTNREIMTWAEVGHLTDWATQAPHLTGIVNQSTPW